MRKLNCKLDCKSYKVFVGIDVSKDTLDISILNNDKDNKIKYFHIKNDSKSIKEFVQCHLSNLKGGKESILLICETTGGYEYILVNEVFNLGYDIHRANTRKVKNYIRSFGQNAKTDKLDSLAIARYGQDRYKTLSLCKPFDDNIKSLRLLAKRHCDLKCILRQEKTRLKSPSYKDDEILQNSIKNIIKILKEELEDLHEKIKSIIDGSKELQNKFHLMATFKGVGEITIFKLLALLPELGNLNRKEIAALSGLAPYAFDSGKKQGRRCIFGGRQEVRRSLYMAGMASVRHNKHMRIFYERLIQNGKKPMQGLVAVMRKIIITLNAMIRDGLEYKYN